jgi:hypothetical protein
VSKNKPAACRSFLASSIENMISPQYCRKLLFKTLFQGTNNETVHRLCPLSAVHLDLRNSGGLLPIQERLRAEDKKLLLLQVENGHQDVLPGLGCHNIREFIHQIHAKFAHRASSHCEWTTALISAITAQTVNA